MNHGRNEMRIDQDLTRLYQHVNVCFEFIVAIPKFGREMIASALGRLGIYNIKGMFSGDYPTIGCIRKCPIRKLIEDESCYGGRHGYGLMEGGAWF